MFKNIILNKIEELEKLRQIKQYKSYTIINKRNLEIVLFEEIEQHQQTQAQQMRKSQVIFKHYENRHLRREIKFVNKF